MAKWIGRKSKVAFSENDTIVEKLAKVRGIDNLDEWYNPPEKFLHSPYLLENIDEAVQRIVKAIHLGQNITILADSDSDGVFACSLMYNYLNPIVEEGNLNYLYYQRSIGHGVENVLPEFEKKAEGEMKYLSKDTDLLIIVDSSSNSVEACKIAKENYGVDIVVIDHHIVEVENPYVTLVNCQIGNYPNKHLSGSAMAYKVCKVLDDYLDEDMADNFLDLATMGLVGDMMSVKEQENRHIIYHGLGNINNLGLKNLLILSKVDTSEDLDTSTISFKVAPAVNSCTRYDKIELALELFTSDNDEITQELAKDILKMNDMRKSEELSIKEMALKKVNNDHKLAILVDSDISSGFRGLVAMQLVGELNKPVFVVKPFVDEEGNIVKYGGSARSIGNLPLREMCEDSRLFNFATGHTASFGVEFDAENMEDIFKYFDEILDENDLQGEIYYDLELDESEVTELDIQEIQKFSRITGQGFKTPIFKITGLVVEEKSTKKLGDHVRAVMGSDRNTVKINIENSWALMKFRTKDTYALDIEKHFYTSDSFMTQIEAVGQINLNSFYNYGTRRLEVTKQVFVDDYRIV